MSTDEYSQELPDEMYLHHRTPSAASTSYPNLGSSSSCSLPMPANMEMAMMAHNKPQQAHHHHHHHGQAQSSQHQQQQMMSSGLDHLQRQKRKYTRRKQPEERKKRGPRTKDINAPRMPLNGYVRFLNANRERIKKSYPTLSFAEVTKKLASEWSSMSSDEKKAYLDEAERAKEMYLKELQEYQKTDSYQEFLNMKQRAKQQPIPPSSSEYGNMSGSGQFPTRYNSPYGNSVNDMSGQHHNPHLQNHHHLGSPSGNQFDLNEPMQPYSGGNGVLSNALDKCNSVMDLPIYTEEFLEHNKMREQELRNYRALTTEYEEENAILSKHVDDMTSATERLIQDETKERETNGRLKAVFEMLQQNIVEQFHDVELPQTYWPANYCEQNASSGTISEHGMSDSADSTTQSYRANMDNIDQFMYGLDHFAQSYNGNAAMS
ncbi:hypothetical protein RDWZM_004455, partial [Blomia tropicalis]